VVHKLVAVAVALQRNVSVSVFKEPAAQGLADAVDGLGVFPDVPGVVVSGEIVQRIRVHRLGAAQVNHALTGLGCREGLTERGTQRKMRNAGSGLHPVHAAPAL